MGLLKTPEREENPLSPSTNEALKDPSPFKVKILDKKASYNASYKVHIFWHGQKKLKKSPNIWNYLVCIKGQLISKGHFGVFKSALASKKRLNQKNNALYYTN